MDTDHRLSHWEDWREKLVNLFSAAVIDEQPDEDGVADLLGDTPGAGMSHVASSAGMGSRTGSSAAMGQRTLSQSAALSRLSHGDLASLAEKGADKEVSAEAVAQLPDFSHLLPEDYRKDYMSWRGGQAKGAKGEVELLSRRMQAMQDSLANNTSEEFTEVSVFRQGYAAWRRGKDTGAKSFASHWAV